jgi:tRNA threonylcarbamoyladenosine biosynthesis protein TsaE
MDTEIQASDGKLQITTHSPEETRQLGEKIGERIQAGTTITLTGDLGSGKTVFIQGLARGLGVPEDCYITSPSYTLINEYPARHTLFHVDLYRIENPVDFEDIGLYEILDQNGVVAIEWADRLHEDLWAEHVNIQLKIAGDESRLIFITASGLGPTTLLKNLQKSNVVHP